MDNQTTTDARITTINIKPSEYMLTLKKLIVAASYSSASALEHPLSLLEHLNATQQSFTKYMVCPNPHDKACAVCLLDGAIDVIRQMKEIVQGSKPIPRTDTPQYVHQCNEFANNVVEDFVNEYLIRPMKLPTRKRMLYDNKYEYLIDDCVVADLDDLDDIAVQVHDIISTPTKNTAIEVGTNWAPLSCDEVKLIIEAFRRVVYFKLAETMYKKGYYAIALKYYDLVIRHSMDYLDMSPFWAEVIRRMDDFIIRNRMMKISKGRENDHMYIVYRDEGDKINDTIKAREPYSQRSLTIQIQGYCSSMINEIMWNQSNKSNKESKDGK